MYHFMYHLMYHFQHVKDSIAFELSECLYAKTNADAFIGSLLNAQRIIDVRFKKKKNF